MKEADETLLRNLPEVLPVFPVQGVVLFPRAPLPLNIFEPRYIALVEEALGRGRMLGVVQPIEPEGKGLVETGSEVSGQDVAARVGVAGHDGATGSGMEAGAAEASEGSEDELAVSKVRAASPGREYSALVPERTRLCRVGSLGKITEFSEEEDGRFLIVIRGLARFDVESECPLSGGGFRRVRPDWARFQDDFHYNRSCSLDRETMMSEIVPFLGQHGFEVNEEQLAECSDEDWVNLLAQIIPSSGQEKQALLELMTVEERALAMMKLISMNQSSMSGQWPTVQ